MEVVQPKTPQGKSTLSKSIKTKVLADGTSGECAKFVIAQSIDVTSDYAKTLSALQHKENSDNLFRMGEINNAEGDKTIDFTNTISRAIAQEVKNLHKPNFLDGNVYGFDFSETGRLTFPTKQEDQVKLFENINTYYLTFAPGTSEIEPLLVAQGWVMATIASNLDEAKIKKTNAAQNHRDSKTETALMNADMATPEINQHKFADFLQNRHRNDGRALGAYGFDTSDAPSLEKPQMSGVPVGVDKQLQHIVLGEVMTNMTGKPVQVFKGTKKKGPGVTIPAYGELKMTAGYSKCIVTTADLLDDGIVKVIVYR